MFEPIKNLIRRTRVFVLHGALCHAKKLSIRNRTLIVAPHPDDEALGCAGLIQRLLSGGKQIDVVILSGGERSHAGCCQTKAELLIRARRDLSRKAADILGLPIKNLHFLNYPDGNISFDCPETDLLKNLIETLQPDAIFVPHKGEGWSDHLAAGEIVRKLIGDDSRVELYEYCVWFWFYNVWKINWKKARIVAMSRQEHVVKNQVVDAYVLPKAPCGKPWSGMLPRVFVNANRWTKELYFKVK